MSGTAKIIRKIVFDAEMRNESPLLISSGRDDGLTDILILKNKQGQPYIPGTSLAGVLRDEIGGIYGNKIADRIFGSIEGSNYRQSMITVSDVILENYSIIIRDGIAVDHLTGVTKKEAKFNFEAIDRGAKGKLYMEITVRQKDETLDEQLYVDLKHSQFAVNGDLYGDIAAEIADIITSGIKLGSLTAKGYGRVASVTPVRIYDFNFSVPGAAEAWMNFISCNKLPEPEKANYSGNAACDLISSDDLYVSLDCALGSSLLVRNYDVFDGRNNESAKNEEISETNLVSVQMKSRNDYVIPGTSIKGVLRSKAYKILLKLSNNNEIKTENFLNEFMGYAASGDIGGKKSKLEVDEVYINSDKLKAVKQSRIRINRFTGGTITGALFNEEPVWQQDKSRPVLTFKFRIKKCSDEEAGLMLLLIKDIWLGNLCVGSGKGIGRGVLRGHRCSISYKGDNFIFENNNGFHVQGDKELLELYVQALGGEMNE